MPKSIKIFQHCETKLWYSPIGIPTFLHQTGENCCICPDCLYYIDSLYSRHFYFSLIYFIFFQDHNWLSTFSPWHIILKHASTVYNKHGQVLTNIRRRLPRNLFRHWNKKSLSKIRDNALMDTRIFSIPETFWDTKRAPFRFFSVRRKVIDTFFVIPSKVYQKFGTRKMVIARKFQKHLELMRDKKISCKNRDTPAFMCKVFQYSKLLEAPTDWQRRVRAVLSLF